VKLPDEVYDSRTKRVGVNKFYLFAKLKYVGVEVIDVYGSFLMPPMIGKVDGLVVCGWLSPGKDVLR